MSTLLDGALVLGDSGFFEGAVLVEGERIAAVADAESDRLALRGRAGEVFDTTGLWLIPGLIDAHAHGYATLLRGTENSLPLEQWALFTVLYGRAFDARAIRAAILLGAAERIRAGITGWVDHSPMLHLAEAAIAAHEESGLRVSYAPFLHDLSDYDLLGLDLPPEVAAMAGGPPPLDVGVYAARFAEVMQAGRGGSGRVSVLLGPNAPQRCSPAAWTLWRTLRDRHDVAVHTHLMETRAQASLGRRWPGGLVAEMERQDLLDARLSVAHGIWLSPCEREVLARHGVAVVHNPASNLMLGSGVLPFAESLAAGLSVALGTDSANTGGRHDLFETMRLAMMLPRVHGLAAREWPRGRTVLDMATRNGAKVLGCGAELGRIAAGQFADLVLVQARGAATLAMEPNEDALVRHSGPEAVVAVMAGGRWLLRDGVLLAFDEATAIGQARDAIERVGGEVKGRVGAVRVAVPALEAALAAAM